MLLPARPAAAGTVEMEAYLVDLVNEARAGAGAAPVVVMGELVELARAQASEMAAAGRAFHSTGLASRLPENMRWGENVGIADGAGLDVLHAALVGSEPHRTNLLHPDHDRIGVGVRVDGSGRLFVAQILINSPHPAPPPDVWYPVPASEEPLVAGPAEIPHHTWYFAEGYTGPGFREHLEVLNPGAAGAEVEITYLLTDGTVEQVVHVGARSRLSIDVNAAVGEGREVSAVVRADQPVVAERVIDFVHRGTWAGQTALIGRTAPRRQFHFAEGYTTATFDTYLTLANPGSSSTEATVSFHFLDGSTQQTVVGLPARARRTVDVRAVVGADREVAISVAAGRPILAERAMYFSYNGWEGGHISAGMVSPATHMTFAEGYTGPGFDQYITMLNPGDTAALATLSYLTADGGVLSQAVVLAPRARHTIRVNDVVPDREVAVDIDSDMPLVAERVMYFEYRYQVSGGHCVAGSASLARHVFVPSADTRLGAASYITVANPASSPVAYTVVFVDDSGSRLTRNFTAAARSRQTLDVAREAGSGRRLGFWLSAAGPVAVETVVYSRASSGGEAVVGFSVA